MKKKLGVFFMIIVQLVMIAVLVFSFKGIALYTRNFMASELLIKAFTSDFDMLTDEIESYTNMQRNVTEKYNANIDQVGLVETYALKKITNLNRVTFKDYAQNFSDNYSALIYLDKNRNFIYSTYEQETLDGWTDSKYDSLFDFSDGSDETYLELEIDDYISVMRCIKTQDGYVVFESAKVTQSSDADYICGIVGDVSFSNGCSKLVYDTEAESVIYSDLSELEGQSLNFNKNADAESYLSTYEAEDGTSYSLYGKTYKDQYIIAIAISSKDFYDYDKAETVCGIIAILFAFVLTFYAWMLKRRPRVAEDEIAIGKFYMNKKSVGNFLSMTVVLYLLSFAFLLGTSFLYSNLGITIEQKEDGVSISELMTRCYDAEDGLEETFTDQYCDMAQMLNFTIESNPELKTKTALTGLSTDLGIHYISVYNSNGEIISTSSPYDHLTLEDMSESDQKICHQLLLGQNIVYQNCKKDIDGESVFKVGITTRDSEGVADGFILFAFDNEITNTIQDYYQLDNNFLSGSTKGSSFIISVDKETNTIVSSPNDSYKDWTLDNLGVSDSILLNGYVGLINFDGQLSTAYVSIPDSDTDTAIIQLYYLNDLFNHCIKHCFYLSLIFLFIFLCIFLTCMFYHQQAEELTEAQQKKNEKGKVFYLLRLVFLLFALAVTLAYFVGNMNSENTIIGFIRNNNWSYGVNPYALAASVISICIGATAILIINRILHFLSSVMESGGETICKLLDSFAKYGIWLYLIIKILTYFGVDTTTTLASLGILSMAIGLGAKDLIGDIIAGLFIVFEGNYKVGDMLIWDGEWYWVKSIGIRTTKLEAWGKLKIINNSEMKQITNTSNSQACVDVDVTIGNEYKIDEIEALLTSEWENLEGEYLTLSSGPYFRGVQHLDSNGTTIRIRLYCPIDQQGWIGRALKTDLRRIFEKHNIRIAVPEYVVTDRPRT